LPKPCFFPLCAPLHPPFPLCIIHHRGVLPSFPRLFLPSMPVTLAESPNPLLLPTTSLTPSGSQITSLFFYPFPNSSYLWVPLPCLPLNILSSLFSFCLMFPHHSACSPALHSRPLFYVFQSCILLFPSPSGVLSKHHVRAQSSLLTSCNSLSGLHR